MRRLGGELGVTDLAGIELPTEHLGGRAGVVEDGGPELPVLGNIPPPRTNVSTGGSSSRASDQESTQSDSSPGPRM